jgi:TRAP-type C4-dicarboxylate transport system permease small subunit
MPRIKTIRRYLAFVSGLVLALLAIVGYVRLGVLEKIFGIQFTNSYIYPILSNALQVVAYIAISVILGLIVWGTWDYFHNYFPHRHDPPKPDLSEQIALLTKEVKGLRQDLKNRGKSNGNN